MFSHKATGSLIGSDDNASHESSTFRPNAPKSSESNPSPFAMTIGELMKEHEFYDIDTSHFIENVDLVEVMLKARAERKTKTKTKIKSNESRPLTPTLMDLNSKSISEEKRDEENEETNNDEKAEENEEIDYKSFRVSFNSSFLFFSLSFSQQPIISKT